MGYRPVSELREWARAKITQELITVSVGGPDRVRDHVWGGAQFK